jgi:hypothetical protein
MPKKLLWLRSPTSWDGKPWKNWRLSRSRIRCWPGTESKSWGRPRVDEEAERLVVPMAKENPGWGYDRIVGAMAILGHRLSDQAVGNILRRHDIPPAVHHELINRVNTAGLLTRQ